MIEADRLVAPTARIEEEVIDRAIRPKSLADYTGQDHVRAQMAIFIEAARGRQSPWIIYLFSVRLVWVKPRWR